MKKKLFLLLAVPLVMSCTTISGGSHDQLEDQYQAENRLMKNKLNLALRENEILNAENAHYKKDLNDLHAKVESLNTAIESLNKKYDADMAQMNARYEELCAQYTMLEQDSDKKIETLTSSKTALEKEFDDEVSRLNQAIKDQQKAFSKERDQLNSELTTKTQEYEKQTSLLTQEIIDKESTIDSLADSQKQDQEKIGDLEKAVKEGKTKADEFNVKNQSLTEANQKLQKIIDDKQAQIDDLNRKLASSPATDQMQPK
jgi:chromosome segregation ATPase